MVKTITIYCPFKVLNAKQFSNLTSRIGRSKVHLVKSKFLSLTALFNLNIKKEEVYILICRAESAPKLINYIKRDI